MRGRLALSSLIACTALLLSNSVVLAANNWLGKWTLDTAASHYSGGSAPKSQTLTFEATADGIKLTAEGVDAEGKPTHTSYVSKFDGKTLTLSQTGTNAKGVAVKNTVIFRRG